MVAILYLVAAAVPAFALSRFVVLPWVNPIRLLSALVMWMALVLLPLQVLAALELMGWIAAIHLWALAGVQVSILVATLFWVGMRKRSTQLGTGEAPINIERPAFVGPLPIYLWIGCGLLACSYLVCALNLFSSYPNGADALTYHLPVALHWLQSGSLRIPSSRVWQFGLPGNAEIGMMLLMSTGHEAVVPLVNVFAAGVLALSTYAVAMRVAGGNRWASTASATIALSMPIVEFQSFSGYVDLFGTAFLMAAVALFLARHDVEGANATVRPWPSTILVLLAAVACGISVGTKPVFYVYAAAFCGLAAIALMRESFRERRDLALKAAVVALGVLLPSVFWFGRAFAETANPLFPMRVKVGQHVVFEGFSPSQITTNEFSDKFVRRRAEWVLYPWTEYLRNPGDQLIPYGEGSGTGAAFAAFIPLGLLFAGYRAFSQRAGTTEKLLLVTLLGLAVVWWTSLQRMPRFGLPLLVLACILAAPFLGLLQAYKARGFGILLVGCLAATCGISAFIPLRELAGRVKSHAWRRSDAYGYPHLVDELPAGTTLLNDTGMRIANYTLAGKRLSNRVIADFEVPDPITPEFLAEHHVDFVVEATPLRAVDADLTPHPNFATTGGEHLTIPVAGKRWELWRVGEQSKGAGVVGK